MHFALFKQQKEISSSAKFGDKATVNLRKNTTSESEKFLEGEQSLVPAID